MFIFLFIYIDMFKQATVHSMTPPVKSPYASQQPRKPPSWRRNNDALKGILLHSVRVFGHGGRADEVHGEWGMDEERPQKLLCVPSIACINQLLLSASSKMTGILTSVAIFESAFARPKALMRQRWSLLKLMMEELSFVL